MPAALSTFLTKPAELQDFLRSCGANDVDYYPAVHPDCDNTCGVVRLTMGLRSCRWFMNLRHFLSSWVQHCERMQCYCFAVSCYRNTLCWSRLQGKTSKTYARRLPRSPCSARRFHSISFSFFFFSWFVDLVFILIFFYYYYLRSIVC